MTNAQHLAALSAIETHALTVAAHSRLALEGSPAEALAAYVELKKAAGMADTRMDRMQDFESTGHAEEDDAVFVVDMVAAIEFVANKMTDFGNLMLRAAHAGLVEAAIEGNLDYDANAWHLPSIAESSLNTVIA